MIRIPLKQNGVTAQKEVAGAHHTPPATTSNKTNRNQQHDSTEARLARQDAIVRRINNVGLSVILALCIATGVSSCIDAAHASAPAQADSASNGIITTGTDLPCLVLNTPQSEAVATPTDKRGFITPKYYGCGRDALTRKDSGTASDVCSTSRPPFASERAAGGLFNIPEGI